MNRRRLFSILVGLTALAPALLAAGAARTGMAESETPNLILILTDDQGWFDLGAHGNPVIETQAMDSIAREGVRFSRFYAAPVCTPTRAGLMTGRYFPRTGAIDTYLGRDVLRADETTLAEVLQRQGYRTGLVGKWHLGRYMRYHPTQRGFDEFFGFWQYGFINRYFDSDELFHNREPVATTGYVTDVLTDAAISFVRRNRERPFFLYLAYNAPHAPYFAPDPYVEKYVNKGLPLREAQIYGMVECVDDNLGRLLAAVDDAGLRQKTVVLFMTDNGGVSTHFKAGLRGNKGSVYEGGIRVPLFVRWPGRFPAGAAVDALAEYVDVFPTLCELAGAPLPAGRRFDGRSLLSLLRNGSGPGPHETICQQWTRVRPNPNENWMVRDRRYKLANGELYDLENDPGETNDLGAKRPEVVRRLRATFEEWYRDVTTGQEYARPPIEVGREDENPVEIDVTWGEPVGQKVKPTYRRYIRDAILDWSEAGDAVRWPIVVTRAGRYEVTLAYGCPPGDEGSRFRVSIGEARLEGAVGATAGKDVFQARTAGVLDLPKGPATLEIRALSVAGGELMTLHKVWLRRVA